MLKRDTFINLHCGLDKRGYRVTHVWVRPPGPKDQVARFMRVQKGQTILDPEELELLLATLDDGRPVCLTTLNLEHAMGVMASVAQLIAD